jgi:hypothetical protein
VTAGGLSPDAQRWVPSLGERYLAPTRLLAARFRAKLLRRLLEAERRGALRFAGGCKALGEPGAFARLEQRLRRKSWIVYAKAAFTDLPHLLRYLARYTHRAGISDRRLLDIHDDFVTFATKSGGTVELHVFDFLDRFLLHVLPRSFVKIRHYGLLASAARDRLERARALLDADDLSNDELTSDNEKEPSDPIEACPQCFFGRLVRQELPSSSPEPPPPHT